MLVCSTERYVWIKNSRGRLTEIMEFLPWWDLYVVTDAVVASILHSYDFILILTNILKLFGSVAAKSLVLLEPSSAFEQCTQVYHVCRCPGGNSVWSRYRFVYITRAIMRWKRKEKRPHVLISGHAFIVRVEVLKGTLKDAWRQSWWRIQYQTLENKKILATFKNSHVLWMTTKYVILCRKVPHGAFVRNLYILLALFGYVFNISSEYHLHLAAI